ncbi:MAG TPA: DUF3040 domain-containing protein, partial [Acidimicrobiales bacterium]|nr:DUF3040 domain-containing protein [Acidimicrobiales bacterium]
MTSSQGQGGGEPLSDEERRVLEEIERTFHLQDPSFSTRLRSETVYRHAGRACSWGIAVFLVGLALLVS